MKWLKRLFHPSPKPEIQTPETELPAGLPTEQLRNAYDRVQSVLGASIEPFEAVQLVNEYRQYWRPKDTRVILLAESHVFTTLDDMDISFNAGLPKYPQRYAKFVYCVAYGERQLTNDVRHPRDGTPQYWKIFYSCANEVTSNEDFAPVQAKTPDSQRLENKIRLLRQLQGMGVWLVDTSIAALYDRGQKPPRKRFEEPILASWQGYTKDLVTECQPRHVICIGKDLGRILAASLHNVVGESYSVLPQPNARLPAEEHMEAFRTYYKLCSKYCTE